MPSADVGYRVDVIHEHGDLFACSQVVTQPPWTPIDDAIQEAESLVGLLRQMGIGAAVQISIVKTKGRAGVAGM